MASWRNLAIRASKVVPVIAHEIYNESIWILEAFPKRGILYGCIFQMTTRMWVAAVRDTHKAFPFVVDILFHTFTKHGIISSATQKCALRQNRRELLELSRQSFCLLKALSGELSPPPSFTLLRWALLPKTQAADGDNTRHIPSTTPSISPLHPKITPYHHSLNPSPKLLISPSTPLISPLKRSSSLSNLSCDFYNPAFHLHNLPAHSFARICSFCSRMSNMSE